MAHRSIWLSDTALIGGLPRLGPPLLSLAQCLNMPLTNQVHFVFSQGLFLEETQLKYFPFNLETKIIASRATPVWLESHSQHLLVL